MVDCILSRSSEALLWPESVDKTIGLCSTRVSNSLNYILSHTNSSIITGLAMNFFKPWGAEASLSDESDYIHRHSFYMGLDSDSIEICRNKAHLTDASFKRCQHNSLLFHPMDSYKVNKGVMTRLWEALPITEKSADFREASAGKHERRLSYTHHLNGTMVTHWKTGGGWAESRGRANDRIILDCIEERIGSNSQVICKGHQYGDSKSGDEDIKSHFDYKVEEIRDANNISYITESSKTNFRNYNDIIEFTQIDFNKEKGKMPRMLTVALFDRVSSMRVYQLYKDKYGD